MFLEVQTFLSLQTRCFIAVEPAQATICNHPGQISQITGQNVKKREKKDRKVKKRKKGLANAEISGPRDFKQIGKI